MLGLLWVFAQVSLLLNSAVGFARPLHHCCKRVACSQLALLHTVAAVRGCDPLSDQVRQAGSVVEGEVDVGRAVPVSSGFAGRSCYRFNM